MKVMGLHGLPHVGKDEIADYLVRKYNVIKLGFGDALYQEVCQAFDVPFELLTTPSTKETPNELLALFHCHDPDFRDLFHATGVDRMYTPRSPRTILDHWGTQYRRAQNENYWVDKLKAVLITAAIVGLDGVVIKDVRRSNEAEVIKNLEGLIFHVTRPGTFAPSDNVIHRVLAEGFIDGTIDNSGTLDELYALTDVAASRMDWAMREE